MTTKLESSVICFSSPMYSKVYLSIFWPVKAVSIALFFFLWPDLHTFTLNMGIFFPLEIEHTTTYDIADLWTHFREKQLMWAKHQFCNHCKQHWITVTWGRFDLPGKAASSSPLCSLYTLLDNIVGTQCWHTPEVASCKEHNTIVVVSWQVPPVLTVCPWYGSIFKAPNIHCNPGWAVLRAI